jgi:V/A-type H+/Na+-transporting ATPase subunit E
MPLYDQVELLCQAISSQVRTEAEQIAAQARQEADALVAAAQTRRQEALARTREEVAAQAQLTARSLVDRAQLTARRQAAQAKETMLNDILAQGLQRLKDFRQSADYQNWLRQALAAAIKQLGDGGFKVAAHPGEARWLTPEFLAAEGRDCGCSLEWVPDVSLPAGGFVLVRADGKVRLDQTFQGIMERQRESLRAAIARKLWECARL